MDDFLSFVCSVWAVGKLLAEVSENPNFNLSRAGIHLKKS